MVVRLKSGVKVLGIPSGGGARGHSPLPGSTSKSEHRKHTLGRAGPSE